MSHNSQNPSCSSTLTQFISCSAAAQQLLNYSRVILRNNYVQLQQSNSQNPSCSSTPIQFISCSAAAQLQQSNSQKSIMFNYSRVILRINYVKPRPHSLSAAQQLLSSCSITAEQFSESIMFNYSRVILRIHHAQVHPYSLSAAKKLPAAAQLQQSNSQNQLCSITPTQFISCSAAAQQLLNYSR